MINNKISVDKKTIEEYGSDLVNNPQIRTIQQWLSMPLNSTNPIKTGMPDITVQSSQKPAYVILYCTLQVEKIDKDEKQATMTISIGKEPKTCEVTYNLDTKKITFLNENDVKIRINNKDDYVTQGQNLFNAYVKESILYNDATLKAFTFKKISTTFFEYIKSRPKLDYEKIKQVSFSLYILPTKLSIEKKSVQYETQTEFIDCLGNTASSYPSKTTLTAKFLSYDDMAFTINCKQNESFYKDIGLGNNSLDKIEFPAPHVIQIGKIKWIFIDMQNIATKFEEKKQGFLKQIHHHYSRLNNNQARDRKSNLKIIAWIQDQNKTEILLDENRTMDNMEHLFRDIKSEDILFKVFEIMIPTKTRNTLWADYIYTIRSFLAEHTIPKHYFIKFFTKELKKQLSDFLKSENVAKEFFDKSEFMIRYLSQPYNKEFQMNDDETFAFSIGKIAKAYIVYKKQNNEKNNSLVTILTYSKYNRQSLRHILSIVAKGIELSKAEGVVIDKIEAKIQKLIPKNEINNEKNDYSYFFYKGYFTVNSDD